MIARKMPAEKKIATAEMKSIRRADCSAMLEASGGMVGTWLALPTFRSPPDVRGTPAPLPVPQRHGCDHRAEQQYGGDRRQANQLHEAEAVAAHHRIVVVAEQPHCV